MTDPIEVSEAAALRWAQYHYGRNWGAVWRAYSDQRCCVGFVAQHSGAADGSTRTLRGSGATWAEAIQEALTK